MGPRAPMSAHARAGAKMGVGWPGLLLTAGAPPMRVGGLEVLCELAPLGNFLAEEAPCLVQAQPARAGTV